MSEHYDFHYQPTGSGAISGQQVLKQTEDAINELGDYVNDNVGGAMDVAQQALETAQNAETNAQTALDTANSFSGAIQSAQQDASTALSTAQTAQTTASNANNTAIQASQDASSAVTTANNASGQVSTLSGTVTALGQRVTTAEGNIGQNTSDITALTTRVGTAEGNITTLQNDVSIAQGNASSAMATAGTVKQQSYVLRYSSTAVTDNSTIAFSTLDNTDNIKSGDKVIDVDGKIFSVVSVDTANSTVTVGSALIDLALDSTVVHTSGSENVGGIKNFTDDTYIKSLNFTNNVPSPSSSSSSIMPIIITITYDDGSPAVHARFNFRVTADGSKSIYPHETGLYSLGLASRYWDGVYSYMYDSTGKNLGNEFSGNARTNLYLKSNRDTAGQSGLYISKFRQNRAQGEMGAADVVQIAFDVLENSVRTNRTWYLSYSNWVNDVPKTVEVRSLCEKVDYILTHINDLEPSSLSLPDLSNGIDISSYITLPNTHNTYTPPVNGWISIILKSTSGALGLYIYQGDLSSSQYSSTSLPNETEPCAMCCLPVVGNTAVSIDTKGSNAYVVSAKFFPCLGNV